MSDSEASDTKRRFTRRRVLTLLATTVAGYIGSTRMREDESQPLIRTGPRFGYGGNPIKAPESSLVPPIELPTSEPTPEPTPPSGEVPQGQLHLRNRIQKNQSVIVPVLSMEYKHTESVDMGGE